MISTHNPTVNSYGRAEVLIDKYISAVQQGSRNFRNSPHDPIMTKITFLDNIEDEAYMITTEILSMDDHKTHKKL